MPGGKVRRTWFGGLPRGRGPPMLSGKKPLEQGRRFMASGRGAV